ncbi:MAG: hypothetical protein IJ849_06885 [Selenomonadaceae bacterium]|nr:hypothetical protein [Selenomonadaceae bacterium]
MAVTVPTPPTPPTPPTVPKVNLQEGGSVHESTVPQNSKQDNDTRLENQARQAVADGKGALTKKVVTRPESAEKKEQSKETAEQNEQRDNTNTNASTETKNMPVATPATQTAPTPRQEVDMSVFAEDNQETGALTAKSLGAIPTAGGEHGVLYWGFSIISGIILAVVFFKVFMKKKEPPELTTLPKKSAPPEENYIDSVGLKVGDALKDLETQKPLRKKITPKNEEKPQHFEVRI